MVTLAVPWAAVRLDDHLAAGWPQQAASGRGHEKEICHGRKQCVWINSCIPQIAIATGSSSLINASVGVEVGARKRILL